MESEKQRRILVDVIEIPPDGELWELFAQDFLREIGFFVESQPDRGPDAGKDLLVTEDLTGALNKYKFKWLVSCKHFAHRDVAVSERDELNIQERLDSFNADGFLGFYSTVQTSGLNNRLRALKENGRIKDFQFFNSTLIENYLIRVGFSKLLMRYFPESYKRIKPLHLILDQYVPLHCDSCGKDLLESLNSEDYQALVALVKEWNSETGHTHILDMYWACKGECDRRLERRYRNLHKATTSWEDISDLIIPSMLLRWIIATLNQLRAGTVSYSDKAFEKEKDFLIAMSQKVFREMTEDERNRANRIFNRPPGI
jgi:hypothetical protein